MFGDFGHLAKRFFGSLRRRELDNRQEAYVASVLSTAEYELWSSQSRADRYHTFVVAQCLQLELQNDKRLASGDTQWVISAGLLHDIGKIDSNLGTLARVAATLAGVMMPTTVLNGWHHKSGLRQRINSYLNHAEVGAQMLQSVRSDARVVTWARGHHQPRGDTPPEIAQLLKRADNAS